MSHVLTPKPPADTVAYLIDWRQQLAVEGVVPDVIKSFTLTITSGTITVPVSQNLGLAVEATISGGADGEMATLHLEVVTYAGQTLHRDLSLLVSATAVAITPETTTKRTIIDMAYNMMGLTDYEFDTTNEEKAAALRSLDAMMAVFEGPGFNLQLGYNFPPFIGGGNYSDPAGVPDDTIEAIAGQLAKRQAPYIGKTLAPEAKTVINQSMNALRAQYAVVPNRPMPRLTIVGAGQKPWSVWSPFFGNRNVGAPGANIELPPLVVGGSPQSTVTIGLTYLFVPTLSGAQGVPMWSIANKPTWAVFDTATGILSGTPTTAEVDSNILISVTDGLGCTASLAQFSITVVAPAADTGIIGFDYGNPNQLAPFV